MKNFAKFLFVIILYFAHTVYNTNAFREQSLALKGKLQCGQRPLKNVGVQLLEKRKSPFRDQVLASNSTDDDGQFILVGGTSRILQITPVLVVEKDCNGKGDSIKLNTAKPAIVKGKLPGDTFDIGIINMDAWKKPQ
ncbi:unnamed protein product [Auanema sp. JU1783]|nr:unnamed protein product [Auanema sp. JU1783]